MKTASSQTVKTLWMWVLPGLIAGLLFLGIALISGAIATSVWALPDGIARVAGVPAPANYSFALGPVVVGIAIHLAFSIALGAMLRAIAIWLHLRGWQNILAGFILIFFETPIALWAIMHPLLPASTFYYFLGAVPLWGSILGHMLYALALGVLLALHPATPLRKALQPSI
jgi:hypothetical protein